jgi:sugar lactone lactonase YvrE
LPYGVALDASGKIYVANRTGGGGNGSVTVFAAHPSGMLDETPLATITGSNTGLANPSAIALDTSGRIYVTNSAAAGGGSVTVYAANPSGTLNETPLATIAGGNTGLDAPDGVAFDGGANIYVTNENGGSGGNGSVTVYAANPSGALNEAPLATISGSNTGLRNPIGLAVDGAGRIDVVDFFTNSLTVYPANPSGTLNEAPLATIAGSSTLLGSPDGIALDASGKLYVANGYGAITVYAANPSGTIDEAPLGTITGDTTSLFGPVGVAVH